MNIQQLNGELGNVDLYLLDQILKGRFSPDQKILDAGCGEGRNLIYFLNNGYECHGIDKNDDAIRMLHFILGSKYPDVLKSNFVVGDLVEIPFETSSFDWVLSSAVLHFAGSHDHFWQMVSELDRVLKPTGSTFIRCASDIGLTGHRPLDDGRFQLPDGSMRFLLTQEMIDKIKTQFGFEEIEPVKTVVVDKMRCMTTLALKKSST